MLRNMIANAILQRSRLCNMLASPKSLSWVYCRILFFNALTVEVSHCKP